MSVGKQDGSIDNRFRGLDWTADQYIRLTVTGDSGTGIWISGVDRRYPGVLCFGYYPDTLKKGVVPQDGRRRPRTKSGKPTYR